MHRLGTVIDELMVGGRMGRRVLNSILHNFCSHFPVFSERVCSIASAIANRDDFLKKQNCMLGTFYPIRVVEGPKATKQMLHILPLW